MIIVGIPVPWSWFHTCKCPVEKSIHRWIDFSIGRGADPFFYWTLLTFDDLNPNCLLWCKTTRNKCETTNQLRASIFGGIRARGYAKDWKVWAMIHEYHLSATAGMGGGPVMASGGEIFGNPRSWNWPDPTRPHWLRRIWRKPFRAVVQSQGAAPEIRDWYAGFWWVIFKDWKRCCDHGRGRINVRLARGREISRSIVCDRENFTAVSVHCNW